MERLYKNKVHKSDKLIFVIDQYEVWYRSSDEYYVIYGNSLSDEGWIINRFNKWLYLDFINKYPNIINMLKVHK